MTLPRVLVLGGSGTLGQAVCGILAEQGAAVALTYHRDEAAASELKGGLTFPLDLASTADVAETVQRAARALGGLSALIQCAGVGLTVDAPVPEDRPHSIEEIDEAAWDRMLDINLKGTFFAVRAALPFLREGGGGNVVFVSSVDGVKPVPTPVHYATSKGGLVTMARAMAKELGQHGIKVNAVAPGVMEAGMSETLPRRLLEEYEKHCALKRRARPEEIASLIVWLATENTYVNGQTLVVDGAL